MSSPLNPMLRYPDMYVLIGEIRDSILHGERHPGQVPQDHRKKRVPGTALGKVRGRKCCRGRLCFTETFACRACRRLCTLMARGHAPVLVSPIVLTVCCFVMVVAMTVILRIHGGADGAPCPPVGALVDSARPTSPTLYLARSADLILNLAGISRKTGTTS